MSEKHVKDLLMEHFMNPRNVGEIPDADGVGDVGNPICGDIVRLFIKVKGDKIQKAAFKTFGCRAAIATSSILTEMLPGKPVAEALMGYNEWVAIIAATACVIGPIVAYAVYVLYPWQNWLENELRRRERLTCKICRDSRAAAAGAK